MKAMLEGNSVAIVKDDFADIHASNAVFLCGDMDMNQATVDLLNTMFSEEKAESISKLSTRRGSEECKGC